MKKHWQYLKYVLRHKAFVFVAGLQTGAPIWRLIIHDWTKFMPCEWFAYVNYFYGNHPKFETLSPGQKYGHPFSLTQDYWSARFDHAWNHHQKANKHHWQYWLLTNDSDDPKHKSLQMPDKYVLEMVADWMGAGRAITGKWEVFNWYQENKGKIMLQESTRERVESLLGSIELNRLDKEAAIKQRIRILGY